MPVDPVTNRCHPDCEALPGRGNARAISEGHGPRKGASHDAGERRPGAGAEANRMHLDCDSRGVDEERLQILDVLIDPSGLMTVWPGDNDVLRVTLVQPVPFLIAEDVEVEHVKRLEVGLNGRRLSLGFRRRGLPTPWWRLPRRRRAPRATPPRRQPRSGEVAITSRPNPKPTPFTL